MAGEFGFHVVHQEYRPEDEFDLEQKEGWYIYLPHSCDGWDIAGEYYHPVSHEEAVAKLEQFVAEAQKALTTLREKKTTEE